MRRPLKAKQIDAFRVVMQLGSMGRAADALFISQPAVSKLIAHLESDADLKLFDRVHGRLVPTTHGLRLYEEVERIYANAYQVDEAVEKIHREINGHIVIAGTPALDHFLQQVALKLKQDYPQAYISMRSFAVRTVIDQLRSRQVDIGVVTGMPDDPLFSVEPLMPRPLVCLLPMKHPLSRKRTINIEDLREVPFIASTPSGRTARVVQALFQAQRVRLNVVMDVMTTDAVCEFIAADCGVSLLHPLIATKYRDKVAIRPFTPNTEVDFLICQLKETRKTELLSDFVRHARALASQLDGQFK
jgi:DNA-binding transcriptional LysR family regulator